LYASITEETRLPVCGKPTSPVGTAELPVNTGFHCGQVRLLSQNGDQYLTFKTLFIIHLITWGAVLIKAMLCQELAFNGVFKQHGLDEKKVTAAYRKAVTEALRDLMARKFVSERKAT